MTLFLHPSEADALAVLRAAASAAVQWANSRSSVGGVAFFEVVPVMLCQ
jgi:hypothetical protein